MRGHGKYGDPAIHTNDSRPRLTIQVFSDAAESCGFIMSACVNGWKKERGGGVCLGEQERKVGGRLCALIHHLYLQIRQHDQTPHVGAQQACLGGKGDDPKADEPGHLRERG